LIKYLFSLSFYQTESGANLFIFDYVDDPDSYVNCLSNNIFCMGLRSGSIFGDRSQTNCKRRGIAGNPGRGICT
jgi:hypothetical protein